MRRALKSLYELFTTILADRWIVVEELEEHLQKDPCLDNIDKSQISCICYAPNIGYRSWIFRYKGVYVALFDCGNTYYSFHTVVSRCDVVIAVILSWLEGKVYANEVFNQ